MNWRRGSRLDNHAKSLAYMNAAQMGQTEYERIKKLTADMKRCADVLMLFPWAEERIFEHTADFIDENKLDLTADDIYYAFSPDNDAKRKEDMRSKDMLDIIPESFFRYSQFISNKYALRDYLQQKGCVPENKKMAVWRQRQINRCFGSIGGVNRSFIHAPMCIELADGCSVGCPFCGLGAGHLKSLFRYTEENATLFNGVLESVKKIIGRGACFGMMYFATEALDNPDYEKFEDDYYRTFGYLPQITTAVPERDIERTRKLAKELDTRQGLVHRFSLRSLETAEKIIDEFAPLELLNVELIPQYSEAPAFVPYTVVGSEAVNKEHVHRADEEKVGNPSDNGKTDPGTICCIDGFCINFAKKTVKLFTPCHMDEDNPDGIAVACEKNFTDADDFEKVLTGLIDEYMDEKIPKNEQLSIYDYFKICDTGEGRALRSSFGGETVFLSKLMPPIGEEVIKLLMEGDFTRDEIASKMNEGFGADYAKVYYLLDQLWSSGFIKEKKFFR